MILKPSWRGAIMFGFTMYGILAISRVMFQLFTSILERGTQYFMIQPPPATLVVAVFNEGIELLDPAFASFKGQVYDNLEVIVVDDGSDNADDVRTLADKYGFHYIHQENQGKREAMHTAFEHMSDQSEIIFTADSDTIWDKHAARHMAEVLLSDKQNGAVTGEVAVLNDSDNFLTRLINIRYHIAFAHERASQSLFGNVTCVSGPLGAYRRDVIDTVKDAFIGQTFLGQRCTYGDDRHLTNLVLNMGLKVRYADNAICWTYAPKDLKTLVKQQTRWSKSYWREILWQVRVLPKHGPYLLYDWLITAILPFVLLGSVVHHLIVGGHPLGTAGLLIWTVMFMAVIRIIEPIMRTQNPAFLLFFAYSFIYFAVMLPVKFYALATMKDSSWGTRGATEATPQTVIDSNLSQHSTYIDMPVHIHKYPEILHIMPLDAAYSALRNQIVRDRIAASEIVYQY